MDLPSPACPLGYTPDEMAAILGARYDEFRWWKRGQTTALRDGRQL